MLASLGLSPPTPGNIAWNKSSWTSAVMLMWFSALGGHSMVKQEGEVGVEVLGCMVSQCDLGEVH